MICDHKWLACVALACALASPAAMAQPVSPHAGATVYACKKDGIERHWALEPCAEGSELVATGVVEQNGTIRPDRPPPVIDVRPESERAPQAAPAPPSQPAPPSAPAPKAGMKYSYINSPWLWILGFAFAFGLVAKILGRSFVRWAVVGAVTEFVLVGLDLLPK